MRGALVATVSVLTFFYFCSSCRAGNGDGSEQEFQHEDQHTQHTVGRTPCAPSSQLALQDSHWQHCGCGCLLCVCVCECECALARVRAFGYKVSSPHICLYQVCMGKVGESVRQGIHVGTCIRVCVCVMCVTRRSTRVTEMVRQGIHVGTCESERESV